MTLVQSIDLVIAQTEKAIQINGNNGRVALANDDLTRYDEICRFGKRLNSLHSKLIVTRAEITDLCIHGCIAVTTSDKLEEIENVED